MKQEKKEKFPSENIQVISPHLFFPFLCRHQSSTRNQASQDMMDSKGPSHTYLVSKLCYLSERGINVYYIKNNHHSPLNEWIVYLWMPFHLIQALMAFDRLFHWSRAMYENNCLASPDLILRKENWRLMVNRSWSHFHWNNSIWPTLRSSEIKDNGNPIHLTFYFSL